MPDHHLHAYYRFLVNHPELLQSDTDGKSESENKANTESNQPVGVGSGALSLLGSVYGSGEDEDGALEDATEHKEIVSKITSDPGSVTVCSDSERTEFSVNVDGKDVPVAKHPVPPKDKAQVLKRNSVSSTTKSGNLITTKKDGDALSLVSSSVDKSRSSSLQNVSKVESVILEPPSDIKRLVDKIVEFILRNGKQFEAVLLEQDSKHGKFPFLLPSNQYHSYYVKVLQKAQESKLAGKSFLSEKDDATGNKVEKKTSMSKGNDFLSFGAGCDIPYDSDRKEKFRMVIGKSKKDGQDPPSKATQPQFGVSVDAAAAAAILQAATRGIKNPNLGILSGRPLNGDNDHGHNSEDDQASSLGSHLSSQKVGQSVPITASKAIAKTAAVEAANEADSSEAHLTKEQKLKAERLKRARMFVAMLKNGAAPFSSESVRSLSVEPQQSGFSGSADGINLAGKEREGSSVPLDATTKDKEEESHKKNSDDECHERRSRRKYRSRTRRPGEDEEDDDDAEEEEEEEEEEEDRKPSRKKHRSHRSSHDKDKEEDKEDKYHRDAKKKHRSHRSSHEEERKEDKDERDHRHARKKHQSYHSSHEEDGEDDEGERDHRHSRKKPQSCHSWHKDGGDDEDEKDHRHDRKKHQSHLYSHAEDEDDLDEKDRKPSWRKDQSYHSSQEEDDEEEYKERLHKHSSKKHRSHSSSRHSKDRHKHKKRHSSSKNMDSQDQHGHESLSDDKHHHRGSSKYRKVSQSSEELEEGEISSKISDRARGTAGDGVSREASMDLSKSYRDGRVPSQSSEAPEVSDDLRAKIRAMLMATL
ncbi:hypothetical protein NMG60_11037291 [Bertholletia excelsa]